MSAEIIRRLEIVSKAVAKSAAAEVESAIRQAREAVQKSGKDAELEKLDSELSTWQSKLSAILKEPAGRHGMSRHCQYWMEKLRS